MENERLSQAQQQALIDLLQTLSAEMRFAGLSEDDVLQQRIHEAIKALRAEVCFR
ncbi:hypothetical protein D515_01811 [Grimontia indica]|uniref:Uncharacterized protein n=1 Tax=Grimontia indica TaxID=1056512 RepID=R1GT39_9GAMM|nr:MULTISPECIES: hypothetical protein [Grimontia]EOD79358.1 hypothetical protein D515_01811 [Grimontia indica]